MNKEVSFIEIKRGMEKYIEDIKNGKISSEKSRQSLIKAGIIDENGKVLEPYILK